MIVILGIIGLITVPIVSQLMKDSKEKAYYSQIEMLEDTALRWGTQNSEELPKEGNVMMLSFSDLQKGGVLKQETVKDPRTGKDLKGCIYVQYSETYQQYLYHYQEDCDPSMGLWKAPVITVNGKTINQKIRLEVTDSYTIPEGTAVDYEGNPLPVIVKGNVTPDLPGTYEIVYSATDSKGITGTLILTVIVYDPSIPTIDYVIEGTNVNGFYTDIVTVLLTGLNNGEPVQKYEYRINTGSGYQSWNKINTNQFEINTEGKNIHFQVRSRNDNGNLSETKESELIQIDKTKPVVNKLTLSPNTWTANPIIVIVEATDDVSGIWKYSFDNGATWQESNQKSFTESQNVSVLVMDKAEHISEVTANTQIMIDKFETEKPNIQIELVGSPLNQNHWANTDFQVRIEGTTGKSGIKSFQYCTTTNSTCTPNQTITGNSQEVTIHTESSSNKVCARLIDQASQDTGVICSDSYALDKTRPVVNQVTLEPNTWTSGPIKVKVNASDTLSGIFEYSFDEGLTWQSSSEKSFTGNQEIKVMVKDKAGNTSISNASSQITIDKYETTKPTVEYQVVGTPFNSKGWATSNFYLNVISHVGKSGMKSFQYCISNNGSTCTPNITITNTSQAVQITSESMNNKICSVVVDNANQSSGVVCSNPYKLDKTAPNFSGLTIVKSGTTYNGLNTTLTITGSDNLSSIEMNISTSGYGKGSWEAYSKTKAYHVGGTLDGKVRTVYVQLRDQAGHTSNKTVTYTVYQEGSSTTNKNYSAWSNCSKTCGGGTQSRTYQVVDNNTGKVMSTKTQSQACNTQSCGPTIAEDIVNQDVGNSGKIETIDGTTYFQGSNPNNYVKFDDSLWRIISFENGLMKLISEKSFIIEWDKSSSSGSNEWTRPATLNSYLNETYFNKIDSLNRSRIQVVDWNIGRVTYDESLGATIIKSQEKSVKWNGKVGLMSVSDYIYTSMNNNCLVTPLKSTYCHNTNWLYHNSAEVHWTINSVGPSQLYLVFTVDNRSGRIAYSNANGCSGVTICITKARPVIHLRSDVKINGGTGTYADPYIIS